MSEDIFEETAPTFAVIIEVRQDASHQKCMKMKIVLSIVVIALMATQAQAWDGYDYENEAYISIEPGNLVRNGHDVEVYDWSTGTYINVSVESIQSYSYGVEVEVYDWEKDEYRTFEMEK